MGYEGDSRSRSFMSFRIGGRMAIGYGYSSFRLNGTNLRLMWGSHYIFHIQPLLGALYHLRKSLYLIEPRCARRTNELAVFFGLRGPASVLSGFKRMCIFLALP